MTNPYDPNNPNNQAGTQTQEKILQAHEVKSLVQKQGRAILGDKEVVLKHPAHTDPDLQEIANHPALSVKPVGNPSQNGECEYELSANGKSVNIKTECKSCR